MEPLFSLLMTPKRASLIATQHPSAVVEWLITAFYRRDLRGTPNQPVIPLASFPVISGRDTLNQRP